MDVQKVLARRTEPLRRYAFAAVGFALALLVREVLDPWLGSRAPFILFTLPVLVCATFCGRGPAVLAALLGLLSGAMLFAQGMLLAEEVVHLAVFAFVCAGIIFLAERADRARHEATGSEVRAELEARRASEYAEGLNLLIDGAADYAIFMVDPEGRVRIWNKGAERILGWREEEILGQPNSLFYPADEAADGKPTENLRRALKEGRLFDERWVVRKDGSEFLADVTVTPLKTADGKLRGFAKVLRDVTDRRAGERALERREKLLRSVLETVPDGMIVIDERGVMTSVSAAAQKIFGYHERELLGRNVSMLMPSPDREQHDGYIERYLRTGERRIVGIGRVVTGLRKNGSTFPMELAVGEAKTEDQRLFTGFVRDLTEQQRTEAQLQEVQSELIHVSRLSAMGTMASTLAHELNQPLTAIASYAEAIGPVLDSDDPEDKAMLREIFEDMGAQAIRAGGIVRRLREFIARGEVEKRVEDLPTLIREAGELALVGAREKGVSAQFVLDPAAGPVLVDRVQIQQVLINLIRNAVEALDGSELRKITISSAPNGSDTVLISVGDTGPGLPAAVAGQLFQAFVSTKSGGMGLGLSICRTIVEAHGGRISARESEEGGTVFEFTVPRAVAE